MPVVSVGGPHARRLSYEVGASLLSILEDGGVPLTVGCAGEGVCGLCKVRLDGREVLACQVVPRDDVHVEVDNRELQTAWTPIALPGALAWAPDGSGVGRVAALDLGTTRMALAVADVASGRVEAAWEALNPQRRYGADVISRLTSAVYDADARERLRDGPRQWIAALLERQAVTHVCVVSNSAMSTLLLGEDAARLLDPDRWLEPTRAARLGPSVLGVPAHLPAGCGGFVGSDALAAAVHVRLCEGGAPALLIDFGTNTEIVLWDGSRCWVTSAAGGPAFEAMGIAAARPADAGGRDEQGALCGSALVRALADLLRSGRLLRDGRLVGGGDGLVARDIHMLQRAKAAVGAAVEHLTRRADVQPDVIHVTGRFGAALDLEAAVTVGLLPSAGQPRVAPEAALWGALETALSAGAREEMERCREGARLVDLSTSDDYEASFARHLFFRVPA